MVFSIETPIHQKYNAIKISNYSHLFYISSFFGLFPCRGFSVSKGWTVYSFVVIVSTLVVSISIKTTLFTDIYNLSTVLLLGMRIFTDNLCIFSHLLALIFKKKNLKIILTLMRKHYPYNFKISNSRSRLFGLLSVLNTSITCCVYTFCHPHIPLKMHFLGNWSIEVPFFYTLFITLQVLFLLDLVRENLQHLTATLTSNKNLLLNQVNFHIDLIVLFDHINEFYSWQVLTLCIRITANLVMSSYLALLPKEPGHTYFQNVCRIMYRLGGSFRELITLYFISSICSDTQEQVT